MVGPQQRLGISLKEMRVLPNLGNGRSPTEAGNFLEGNESLPNLGNGRSPTEAGNFLEGNESPS